MRAAPCLAALLAAATAAQNDAADHDINIHVEAGCAGLAVPNKDQLMGHCNVKKLVRYADEGWFPFEYLNEETHEQEGVVVDLFHHMCEETKAFAGVACYSVRDAWSQIWTADDFPGEGIASGRFDIAVASVKNLRAQSGAFTHHVFSHLGGYFLAPVARDGHELPDHGDGEIIAIVCSSSTGSVLRVQYSKAHFVCVENHAEQFMLLDHGDATLIAVSEGEWEHHHERLEGAYKTVGGLQHFDYGLAHEVDAIGFFTAKDNVCVRELVNHALEEVMASPWWQTFCADHPHVPCIHHE